MLITFLYALAFIIPVLTGASVFFYLQYVTHRASMRRIAMEQWESSKGLYRE